MALSTFVLVYVIGGVTFVPLLAILILAFAYVAFTKPVPPADSVATASEAKSTTSTKSDDEVSEKSRTQQGEPDVAAAYFAVCREYVPGGINGKPPERSTPAGEVLIAESPSVYQSMYRSIFERGKTQIPTIEGDRRDGRAVKKARNVFFVVLRHGHLMLYDDSEQVEVRHVISLAHHDVDVYAGGDPVSEGDLWIKRNCIRMIRKPLKGDALPSSRPFYFFSDNCSEKEDFYHALLLAQSIILDEDSPPVVKKFETSDIIKLVQHLHASDADAHTRWLNALIGRIFLAMYKTDDLENFIRAKINRKITRVPKPNFIASIQIQEIDMGDSAPVISNPRLKELTVNGDMTVEADIKYNGGFKLQMGAVARIDLGARFKAREVHLIMAGILKKLSGHLLIRIKPPPSNRLWITFESMPQIEMSIEPIVSSRQITYGVILRAIESRIREVIGETIVLPNWDDSPFLDTSKKEYRGGIFETSAKDRESEVKITPGEADAGLVETAVHELTNSANDGDIEEDSISLLAETNAKTMSMPSLLDPVQKLNPRKSARRSVVTLAGDNTASSTGASTSSTPLQTPSSPPLLPRSPANKPRNLRSNSFASAATPLVSTEGANIEAVRANTKKKGQKDAVELVKEVNSRTQPAPLTSPVGTREADHVASAERDETPNSVLGDENSTVLLSASDLDPAGIIRRRSEPMEKSISKEQAEFGEPRNASISSAATTPLEIPDSPSHKPFDAAIQSTSSPSHISTATSAAKKWGWQVLNRQNTSSSTSSTSFGFGKRPSTSSTNSTQSSSQSQPPNANALKAALLAQPMGRGQPLPPPGQPLPGPQKSLWSASNLNLGNLKRKPIPPPLPYRKTDDQGNEGKEPEEGETKEQPPPLPARPRPVEKEGDHKAQDTGQRDGDPDVFVVAAPIEDDEPGTPTIESNSRGIHAYVEDVEDAEEPRRMVPDKAKTRESVELRADEQQRQQGDSDELTETAANEAMGDVSDGEVGGSVDAADVAGEMR